MHAFSSKVRLTLYWVGYFLGVVVSGITSITAIVAAASPTFSMPLWLIIVQAALTIVVSQLNLLSANNVTPDDLYADQIRQWHEAVKGSEAAMQPAEEPANRPVGLSDIALPRGPQIGSKGYRSTDDIGL